MTTHQTDLFNYYTDKSGVDVLKIPDLPFKGSDYDKELDQRRLTGQIERIFNLCKDGQYRTLAEIESTLNRMYEGYYHGQSSISAQLRNLKKKSFGGHGLEKRRRGEREHGLFEYSLIVRKEIY